MNATQKKRMVRVVNPTELGQQLISTKNGRNNKCQCGSGIKQKKCHGDDFEIRSTVTPEYTKKMNELKEAKEAKNVA